MQVLRERALGRAVGKFSTYGCNQTEPEPRCSFLVLAGDVDGQSLAVASAVAVRDCEHGGEGHVVVMLNTQNPQASVEQARQLLLDRLRAAHAGLAERLV